MDFFKTQLMLILLHTNTSAHTRIYHVCTKSLYNAYICEVSMFYGYFQEQ